MCPTPFHSPNPKASIAKTRAGPAVVPGLGYDRNHFTSHSTASSRPSLLTRRGVGGPGGVGGEVQAVERGRVVLVAVDDQEGARGDEAEHDGAVEVGVDAGDDGVIEAADEGGVGVVDGGGAGGGVEALL